MERYEVEYRYYFVEITVRERVNGEGVIEFAVDIRITAEPSKVREREWISVDYGASRGFGSEAAALEDGLSRGMAFVDAVLAQ